MGQGVTGGDLRIQSVGPAGRVVAASNVGAAFATGVRVADRDYQKVFDHHNSPASQGDTPPRQTYPDPEIDGVVSLGEEEIEAGADSVVNTRSGGTGDPPFVGQESGGGESDCPGSWLGEQFDSDP
jgi:hypothetical protein